MGPHSTTSQLTGVEARKKILSGIKKVFDVVALTLGPSGRSVILPRTMNRGQRVADDGYFAAECVIPKDPHERMAADVFKEMISRSNAENGDGTSGTCVFGYDLTTRTFAKYPVESDDEMEASRIAQMVTGKITTKVSFKDLRAQMLDASKLVIAEIKKQSKPVKTLKDLEQIALISIGKDEEEIAKTVAKMVWEVARDSEGNYVNNHIEVTEGYKGEIETEVIRGMRFPAKPASSFFVNNRAKNELALEDIPVLVTNLKVDNVFVINSIIQSTGAAKLAILAPEFSTGALVYLRQLAQKGVDIFPIKVPALRTEHLEDVAVYTGATIIKKEDGAKLENVTKEHLGFAAKIVVKDTQNREDAVLLGGKGEFVKRGTGNMIDERIKVLTAQLKEARNEVDKAQLNKRIASLSAAIGVIRVGSTTDTENLYVKLKIDDGVYACKGALEMGYVKGGGLCLKEIAEALPESILTESLKAPYNQIQKNAGGIKIEKDVIDPAKVLIGIVENGVSVASTLIQAHAVIAENDQQSPAEGYGEIGDAIKLFAYFFAKQHSLIKEGEDMEEMKREKMFMDVMEQDK